VSDTALFDTLRRLKRRWSKSQAGLTQDEVNEVNAALKQPSAAMSAVIKDAGFKPSEVLASKKGPLIALIGAVAATSLFSTIPQHEGTEYKAYRDIASVWSICNGDTANVSPSLIETPEGCRIRLERQLVAHAGGVMACTPRLSEEGRDWQRAAAVSLAYNIGVRAYCHSTVDRRFDSGDWRGACDAFLAWSKAKVGGQLRVVRGLLSRRQEERTICLRNIA
jgi:lysozyme